MRRPAIRGSLHRSRRTTRRRPRPRNPASVRWRVITARRSLSLAASPARPVSLASHRRDHHRESREQVGGVPQIGLERRRGRSADHHAAGGLADPAPRARQDAERRSVPLPALAAHTHHLHLAPRHRSGRHREDGRRPVPLDGELRRRQRAAADAPARCRRPASTGGAPNAARTSAVRSRYGRDGGGAARRTESPSGRAAPSSSSAETNWLEAEASSATSPPGSGLPATRSGRDSAKPSAGSILAPRCRSAPTSGAIGLCRSRSEPSTTQLPGSAASCASRKRTPVPLLPRWSVAPSTGSRPCAVIASASQTSRNPAVRSASKSSRGSSASRGSRTVEPRPANAAATRALWVRLLDAGTRMLPATPPGAWRASTASSAGTILPFRRLARFSPRPLHASSRGTTMASWRRGWTASPPRVPSSRYPTPPASSSASRAPTAASSPTARAGVCLVRGRTGNALFVPWGYTAGVAVDPIEKKPFFHLLPGSTRAVVRHARLRPALRLLPELVHLPGAAQPRGQRSRP